MMTRTTPQKPRQAKPEAAAGLKDYPWPRRKCKWCGERFQMKSSWQEFCEEEHRRLFWKWVETLFNRTRETLFETFVAMEMLTKEIAQTERAMSRLTLRIKLKLVAPQEVIRALKKAERQPAATKEAQGMKSRGGSGGSHEPS